jgi:hypothetical protein
MVQVALRDVQFRSLASSTFIVWLAASFVLLLPFTIAGATKGDLQPVPFAGVVVVILIATIVVATVAAVLATMAFLFGFYLLNLLPKRIVDLHLTLGMASSEPVKTAPPDSAQSAPG